MKKKKVAGIHILANPKLTDRELSLLVLYEVFKLRADIKVLTNMGLEKGPVSSEIFAKIFEFCDKQAFDELQEDIRQFETRRLKGDPLN